MSEAISGFFGAIMAADAGLRRTLTIPWGSVIEIACPVFRQQAAPHVEMKRRTRPFANARYQTVFDGIVVNVIDMAKEIVLGPDRVFPITSLPKGKFAVRVAIDRDAGIKQHGAEVSFDASPASSEIRISFRQGQDRMKVIRQDDDGINRKGPFLSGQAKRGAKRADMIDQRRRSAFCECHREEVGSTVNAVAPVPNHFGMISRISLRSSGLRANPAPASVARMSPARHPRKWPMSNSLHEHRVAGGHFRGTRLAGRNPGAAGPRRNTPDIASLIRATSCAAPATRASPTCPPSTSRFQEGRRNKSKSGPPMRRA